MSTKNLISTMQTMYTIYCSTGCTCCRSENHTVGPFDSKAAADEWVADKLDPNQPVYIASQYSKRGSYSISKVDAEILMPVDGGEGARIILDDRIFNLDENPMNAGCRLYGEDY